MIKINMNVVQWYWYNKTVRMLLRLFALYNLFCPFFAFHKNARAFVMDVTFDATASPGSE